MDNNIQSLDQLFTIAKSQSPMVTFEQTQEAFSIAIASAGATSGVSSFWLKIIQILKNPFIMIGTTGILISTALLVVHLNSKEVTPPASESQVHSVQETPTDIEPVQSPQYDMIASAIESEVPLSAETKENNAFDTSISAIDHEEMTEPIPQPNSSSRSSTIADYSYVITKKEDEIRNEIVFRITNNTSKDELESISHQAREAGVEFNYKLNVTKKRVKRLKLEIKTAESLTRSSLSFSGGFDVEIGWVTDESGRAIELYKPDAGKIEGLLGEAMDELEEKFDTRQIELEQLFQDSPEKLDESFALLNDEFELKFEKLVDLFDEDLDKVSEQIDLINDLELDSILDQIEDSKEEVETEDGEEVSENYKRVSYIINEKTTREELDDIQKQAVNAGIVVSQTADFKKEKLRELHFSMSLIGADGEKMKSQLSVKGGKNSVFSLTVVWRVDEAGNAVDFDGNKCQSVCN